MRAGHLQALAVAASSYSSGEHVSFFESATPRQPWVRSQRLAEHGRIGHAHLMASSAIPSIFPAVALQIRERTEYFGDGSMRQSAPLAPAIHLGAQRIDAIAARHVGALPRPVQRLFVGLQPHSVTQLKAAAFASYLLFETPFTDELIALGRTDTLARREAVCAFFGWSAQAAATGGDSGLSMRTASSTPS